MKAREKKIGRNFNILWFIFSDRKEWKQTWWSLGEIYVFWNSSFSVWHIKKSKGKSEREIMFTLYFLFFTFPIPISSQSVRPNSDWDLGLWESWLLSSLLSPSIWLITSVIPYQYVYSIYNLTVPFIRSF